MALTNGRLPSVDRILSTTPPTRLFHYTSPAGIIGIAKSKTLWATHLGFLNDAKELRQAVDVARNVINNHLEAPTYRDRYSDSEKELLRHMAGYAGAASSAIYVASLTEERDLLSQWRAYCPPGGGYSVGFSSQQLAAMAGVQGFFLSPCVYDHGIQYSIVTEIITCHLNLFRQRYKVHVQSDPKEIEHAGVEFARELSRYGPILKHQSFREEREWRLISLSRGVNDPSIRYRAGKNSVVPYLEFKLQNAEHSDLVRSGASDSLLVVVGPTTDYPAAAFAVQSLGHNFFPPGWAMGRSETPYRGV